MLEIKYNITRLHLQENGYYVSYGWILVETDTEYDVWPALSGRFGRGTLPLGIYVIDTPVKFGDQRGANSYKKEGFPWVAMLHPLGKCVDDQGDRTGLFIHPDGNLKGTLGCLGISERDISLYDKLIDIHTQYKKKEVKLIVC